MPISSPAGPHGPRFRLPCGSSSGRPFLPSTPFSRSGRVRPRERVKPWASAAIRAASATNDWLEIEWLRPGSPVAERLESLNAVRRHAAKARTDGRALVLPSPGYVRLSESVNMLLAWKSTRILAPALLLAIDDQAALKSHETWEFAVVPLPVGFRGELPAGWVRLDPEDDPAIMETTAVLTREGMPVRDALRTARELG